MQPSPPASSILDKIVVWLGAVALVLLGLLITVSVLVRATGGVIKGNSEIGEMLIIVVASCALVAATLSDGHPHIHMIVEKISSSLRRKIALAITCLGAIFWAAAAWMNGLVAIENTKLIEETEILRIPLAPFRLVWIAALALVTALLVAKAIQMLRNPPKD
jgi:TRAP-type C4-dicarboxylate transport system permease small subunit